MLVARTLVFSSVFAIGPLVVGCAASSRSTVPLASAPDMTLSSLAPARGNADDPATAELRGVFAQWQTARGSGDVASLEDLYDASRFEGTRWSRTGVEKRMDFTLWRAEQKESVPASMSERPTFESWPGGTLDLATASVTFVEGGTKHVLVFGRKDGKLRIIREELSPIADATRGSLVSPVNTLSRDAKVVRALTADGR
jgi:hypothetical protein